MEWLYNNAIKNKGLKIKKPLKLRGFFKVYSKTRIYM